jgi:hypothetical protein
LQVVSDRYGRFTALDVRKVAANSFQISSLIELSEVFEAGLQVLLITSGRERSR